MIGRRQRTPGAPSSHIATLWFAHAVSIEMVNIPYPGSAPSLRALLTGEVDVLIDSVAALLTSYRGGLVRILAVAPKRTPMPVVARLNHAVNDALALPEVRAAVDAMALRSVGGTPQDFREFIARDRARRGEAIGGGAAPR